VVFPALSRANNAKAVSLTLQLFVGKQPSWSFWVNNQQ